MTTAHSDAAALASHELDRQRACERDGGDGGYRGETSLVRVVQEIEYFAVVPTGDVGEAQLMALDEKYFPWPAGSEAKQALKRALDIPWEGQTEYMGIENYGDDENQDPEAM